MGRGAGVPDEHVRLINEFRTIEFLTEFPYRNGS